MDLHFLFSIATLTGSNRHPAALLVLWVQIDAPIRQAGSEQTFQ